MGGEGEIEHVAVIGPGVMGAGIAQVLAEAGLKVRLYGRRPEGLEGAMGRIAANQRAMGQAGLISPEAAKAARGRIAPTGSLAEAVADAEFVSENVSEDLALKQGLFRELDRLAPPASILSSDTSGLSITSIGAATARPDRVVGLHWMNPPHLMLPVEVVRGAGTSAATMERTCTLARAVGRIPLRVERDAPGFLWNRLQLALIREAIHIVEQGIATPETVDLAVTVGLGLRWAAVGPLAIMDLAGLPTFHAVASYLYPDLCRAEKPQALLVEAVAQGRHGARAGKGIYEYPPGAAERAIARRDRFLVALRGFLGEHGGAEAGSR